MRLGVLAVVVAAAAGLAWATHTPVVEAIGPADTVGVYTLRVRGNAFARDAQTNAVSEGSVRGTATLEITAAEGDPRLLTVEIALAKSLRGGLLDKGTPTPALRGTGVLVGDSLTVIGAGQANFVNAVTLRFLKRGKRIDGTWIASFPGSDSHAGFVSGAGISFKGKRQR